MEQLQTRLGVLPPLIASSSLRLRAGRKTGEAFAAQAEDVSLAHVPTNARSKIHPGLGRILAPEMRKAKTIDLKNYPEAEGKPLGSVSLRFK
jgi:hypothetical protein